VGGRAWRLEAWAALQEHQERAVGPVGIGDLACEDGQPLAVGLAVVERDGELMLGEDEARSAVDGGHRGTVTGPPGAPGTA
jgi:hypothetical protein